MVKPFLEKFAHVLDLHPNMLKEPVEKYATAVEGGGAPLDSCVGFIDCTKIRMSRAGGPGIIQISCYYGHMRMYFLIYQTIHTPDGLIFRLFGLEAGRWHDLTRLREGGREDVLEGCILSNGGQFYIFGDSP